MRTHGVMVAPDEGYRVVYLPGLGKDEPPWEPWMRFRLTYEGELRASQGDAKNGQRVPLAAHKQEIRKVFHAQLMQLWATDKFLREHTRRKGEFQMPPAMVPGLIGRLLGGDGGNGEYLPLSEYIASNFERNGYRFVPLVCRDFSLLCSLDILFLRRDFGVGVISKGDLDNRVKTLIDTLRMPRSENELRGHEVPASGENPFFCLLEDDDLVTGLTVETGMLLDPSVEGDGGDGRVKLVVTVELKPYDITMFNLGFV